MTLKKILTIVVASLLAVSLSAQTSDNTPKAGDLTLSTNLGYNSFTSVVALPGNQTVYEGAALSTDWTNKGLMLGVEFGWFVHDFWKLSVAGGVNFVHNPGYQELPGTMDPNASLEDNLGEIPSYRAVANASGLVYNAILGFDRYFKLESAPNLMLYTGLRAGFAFANNGQKYDEYTSMGVSAAETWNLRASAVFGVDYFFLPQMYLGMQVEPFAYTYNLTSYRPQEGLSALRADSHNYAVFAAPTLKIGFKF